MPCSLTFLPRFRWNLKVDISNFQVKGVDFNSKVELDILMNSMLTTGFQATQLARAVNEINKMASPLQKHLRRRRASSIHIIGAADSSTGSRGYHDSRFLPRSLRELHE